MVRKRERGQVGLSAFDLVGIDGIVAEIRDVANSLNDRLDTHANDDANTLYEALDELDRFLKAVGVRDSKIQVAVAESWLWDK